MEVLEACNLLPLVYVVRLGGEEGEEAVVLSLHWSGLAVWTCVCCMWVLLLMVTSNDPEPERMVNGEGA